MVGSSACSCVVSGALISLVSSALVQDVNVDAAAMVIRAGIPRSFFMVFHPSQIKTLPVGEKGLKFSTFDFYFIAAEQSFSTRNECIRLLRMKLHGRDKESMRVPLTVAEIGLVESGSVEPDPVNTGVGNRRLHCLIVM